MNRKIALSAIICFFLVVLSSSSVYGYWLWTRESGKWANPKYAVKDTAEEQFIRAEEFLKKDEYKRAIGEYKKIFKKFPESLYSARARLAIGRCYYNMNKFDKALESYQKVIDNYPESEAVKEALELEEKLAEDFSKKKPAGQFLIPQHLRYTKAAKIYEQIVNNFPYHFRAAKLQYKAGWAYYKAGSFKQAVDTFKKLIRNYPESIWVAESSFMIGAIYWKQSFKESISRQDATAKAIESFGIFIKSYPEHHRTKEAREYLLNLRNRQGEYFFNIGEYYYKKEGAVKAASVYYKKVSEEFKDTCWAEKAKEKLLEIEEIEKRIKEEETK